MGVESGKGGDHRATKKQLPPCTRPGTAGINLIDTAPVYGACEAVIASGFQGTPPAGVRITAKCQLGTPSAGTVAAKLEQSLDASLEAMRLDHVDVYFLHSDICEDGTVYAHHNEHRASFATPWSQ